MTHIALLIRAYICSKNGDNNFAMNWILYKRCQLLSLYF